MALLVNLLIEERLVQVQPERDSTHDIYMKIMACLIEVQHGLLEARCIDLLRPLVLPSLVPVSSDFHALFEVRSFGA